MLYYYTCYSVGGYKNLDLGNSEVGKEVSYFLPLLPIWKKENRPNIDDLIEKNNVKELNKNTLLPDQIVWMISYQGYKLLYRHLETGQSVISLRNIYSTSTTDSEINPFLFIIMSDSEDDVPIMDRIAYYFAHHLDEVSQKICDCLFYDSREAGLCFRRKEINEWLRHLPDLDEDLPRVDVPLLVLEKGSENYLYAEEQQRISLDVDTVCYSFGIPNKGDGLHRVYISKAEKKKKSTILTWTFGTLGLIFLVMGGVLWQRSKIASTKQPNLESKHSSSLSVDTTDIENLSKRQTKMICPNCGKECPWCGILDTINK